MAITKHATTVVRRDDGTVVVTLHDTEIVTVSAEGVVTLNSGGWLTNTTKNRMNEVADEYGLNFGVFQSKKKWYVHVPGGDLEFRDGMQI